MALQTVVVFDDPDKMEKIKIGEQEILHILGGRENALAVQLKELFEAVIVATKDVVSTASQITILTVAQSDGRCFQEHQNWNF